MRSVRRAGVLGAMIASAPGAHAQAPNWVTGWTGSAQGPYPVGNASAQPNLGFAFPNPAAGARDQTFRLIVHPGLWGRSARLRFSNAHGTQPVTFDHVFAGEQAIAGTLVKGSNAPVAFGGQAGVTVQPGQSVWSDPVSLPSIHDPADPALTGRKLAVSLHVAGQSGPMTWHAKALTTSYVTAPGAGAQLRRGSNPSRLASLYAPCRHGHAGRVRTRSGSVASTTIVRPNGSTAVMGPRIITTCGFDCGGHSHARKSGQPARERHAKAELPQRTKTAASAAVEWPRDREQQPGNSVELLGDGMVRV